jgi:hypothetical protein
MIKDTIVQFVCFVTKLDLDEFAPKWEKYAQRLMNKKKKFVLQQHAAEAKSKFQYISQHEWPEQDFDFTFMNERRSEHFPEHNVKVIQAGGYVPLEPQKRKRQNENDIKLLAFISHNETDLDFYRELPFYNQLNIHQAFYESCSYGYVLEFFVPQTNADELLALLKQRPGVDSGIYIECLVPQGLSSIQ